MKPIITLRAALGAILICLTPLPSSAAEIIVGQVAPFSGPLAPTGNYLRAGGQLYFDSINASGGIHGAKIRVVAKDDGYKAEETVRLAREILKDSPPLVFFGFVGTGNAEALLKEKVLSEAGIPLLTVRTGAASVVGKNDPNVFFTRASYAEEVEKITQQYASTGYTHFAILYQNDAFGLDVLGNAEAAIKKAGGSLVAKGSYEKNTTKVEDAVKTIAAANPQAVIMISNTAASAEFLKQSRAAGNLAQYVALSVTDGAQVAKLIGNDKAQGLALTQVVPDPASRAIPLIKEIQENFQKFAPKDVTLNQTFVEGYLGAKILSEALRRAGPNPTRKKLRDTLETMKDYDAGGVFIGFSAEKHAGSRFVDITILNRDGKLLR
jgi:ABC-type branched-subunit amino acid transport system substrate-binding protein